MFSVLSKLSFEYSVFVSIFHSKRDGFPSWKIPSLGSFSKSIIQEQEKLTWMGVIQNSKDQAILVIESTKAQAKERPKGKGPKENQNTSKGASSYKKNNNVPIV